MFWNRKVDKRVMSLHWNTENTENVEFHCYRLLTFRQIVSKVVFEMKRIFHPFINSLIYGGFRSLATLFSSDTLTQSLYANLIEKRFAR